jgi:F0F1-type ATP synthase membrane subunit b/b'
MEIFKQLEELFLAAVPTAVVVFLFYLFLRWSFFGPLARVMAERRKRSEGARAEAETLRAAAREKDRAHREALRKARAEVFAEQDVARRKVLDERNAAVQQARTRANEEIQTAKSRMATELEAAREELNRTGDQLAEEIARAVLEPSGVGRT